MEESKDKILKICKERDLYEDLLASSYSDEFEQTINDLKKEYVETFKKTYNSSIFKITMGHSQQSEIFGKLMMLVHEFQGYNGVREVVEELYKEMWKFQERKDKQLNS